MNHEEYIEKIKALESDFEANRLKLLKEYVTSNNPYKVGDIVTDHIGSISISSMGYSWGYSHKPCAKYLGLELNKNGTPKKNASMRTVHQSNLI